MAILTIPTITQGQAATVSLSKSELFALSSISSDDFFSVQANVQFAHFVYDSEPGNQREVLRFDLSVASPSASLFLSAKSRGSFKLEKIVLEDFDGGTLILSGAAVPSGLDVTVGGAPVTGGGGIALGLGGSTLSVTDGLIMLLTSDVGLAGAMWTDQTSRQTAFTLSSQSPVANSFGSIPGVAAEGDETAQSGAYALASGTGAFTAFVVQRSTAGDNASFGIGTVYNPNNSAYIYNFSGKRFVTYNTDSTTSTSNYGPAVYTLVKPSGFSLGNSDFWVNGVKTTVRSNLISGSVSGPALNLGNGKILVNKGQAGGKSGITGAVVLYSRALTDAEVASVTSALMSKFSIV